MLSIKYPVSLIFLEVLFMLFIFAGLPGTSISADASGWVDEFLTTELQVLQPDRCGPVRSQAERDKP